MLKFLTIVVFLFPIIALGQKNINLGQGILYIEFEKQPTLYFYADTNQTAPIKNVSITKDQQGEFIIKNNAQVTTWFKPEGLWLDYSIFVI